jgi:hypothetical protein
MTAKSIGILITLLSLALVGCTGTQVVVKPDPVTMQAATQKHDVVGLRGKASDIVSYAGAGNMTDGFGAALEDVGFAKKVLYPMRSDEKVDLALDSQFTAKVDTHSGANFAKSFFTGFTLFLLEPVIWYDFDYVLEGRVMVSKNGEKIQDVTARSDATVSTKWLSLGDAQRLETEALAKAKKSLYLQLMREIR